MAKQSEKLLDQARALLRSGDRTYETFKKMKDLGAKAEGMEARMIGDLISAFIADDGDTIPPLSKD